MKAVIYTISSCPYCTRAKEILKDKKIPYEEHVYSFGTKEMDDLIKKTNHETVPQIFIDNKFIGGCDNLENMVKMGKI